MKRLSAIARLTMIDLRSRGSLWMVFVIVCVMVVASRWLSIWALGEEVKLYKEFGLSSMALGAALMAAFAAVPIRRRDAVMSAERTILTKSIDPFVWFSGRMIGLSLFLIFAYLLWAAAFMVGLWLYWKQEPTMFSYTRNADFQSQALDSVLPLLLSLLQSLVIAAFAMLAGVRGHLMATIGLVIAFMLGATILPDLAASEDAGVITRSMALLFPDLRLSMARESLRFSAVDGAWLGAMITQTLGYGLAFLLAAAFLKRNLAKS